MASREAVVKALAVFGSLFPRDITPELVSIYHAALGDVSDDQLRVALGKCVQTARFFPLPAELRNAVGANERLLPDVAGILSRIRGLTSYHPNTGEQMPSVERVRAELGDAIANAYGYIGPKRLEAVVFDGVGTGADIAAREFAEALSDAQDAGQSVALPPVADTKRLSNASQSLFLTDGRPHPIARPIAALLAAAPLIPCED